MESDANVERLQHYLSSKITEWFNQGGEFAATLSRTHDRHVILLKEAVPVV
ncbi:MAG: hypothetical protein ABIQ04_03265 [Candidatus Saccharimonadales bacterium]